MAYVSHVKVSDNTVYDFDVKTIVSDSENIVSFTTDVSAPFSEHIVTIEPVQAGTGDPSPSNPRAISGYTGINITKAGVNIFDNQHATYCVTYMSQLYTNGKSSTVVEPTTTGFKSDSLNSGYGRGVLLGKLPAGTYTICFTSQSTNASCWVAHTSTATLSTSTGLSRTNDVATSCSGYKTITFTADGSNFYWFIAWINGASAYNFDNFILSMGSNEQTYEPYKGSITSISWQTEAGTVYYGTLNVKTGLLTVTHGYYDFVNKNTPWDSGAPNEAGFIRFVRAIEGKAIGYDLLCNCFKVRTSTTPSSPSEEGISGHSTNGSIYVAVSTSRLTGDLTTSTGRRQAFNNWINTNGLEICYKLATPITYQLSPTQLSSIVGVNTIWSDTGSTRVGYIRGTNVWQTALHASKTYTDGKLIYSVIGTQTASTGLWTGNIDLDKLYDGLTIAYYLPYSTPSGSNSSLNLTLSNGTKTGAVNCYYTGASRLTTHYGAGSVILLTYYSAGSIKVSGTPTTQNRWLRCDYNANSWRKVQLNGVDKLTTSTSSNPLNIVPGSNVSITESGGAFTFNATDTTYESKAAASGGTDLSLVTTGDKYIWNNKGNGTVTSVKVGSTSYSPTSGVVSLPAYPSVPITAIQQDGTPLTPSSGTVNIQVGLNKDEYGPNASQRILARGNVFVPVFTTNPEANAVPNWGYNGLVCVKIGTPTDILRDIPTGVTWSNFAYFRMMNMSVLSATVSWTEAAHSTSLIIGYIYDNHISPSSNYAYTDYPMKAVTTLVQRDNGSGANRDTARIIISDTDGSIRVAPNGSTATAFANYHRVQFSISYVNQQAYGPNDERWYNEAP